VPPRNWPLRVADILVAINDVEDFVSGMDFESFTHDRKTVNAVIRALTVIGEAANHVPNDIADLHPEIPWADMRDMRNVVVHEYFGVDARVLWDTAHDDLPPLVTPLRSLVSEQPGD
jgi:uncharacterized protein with HEPN domain